MKKPQALKRKNTRPFDITGRAMKGWIMVEKKGIRGESSLKEWTEMAVKFVNSL